MPLFADPPIAVRYIVKYMQGVSDDIVDNNMAAIVSSTKPISLILLCDDVSKMGAKSFEVSNFPTTINTSCEIQEIKKDISLTRLP